MTDPVWVKIEVVHAIHNALLAEHGGAAGVRDEALLASALARPQNLLAYEDPSLFDLAASYIFGIVRNHPFVDGNKRTGLMVGYTFLHRNGYELNAPEPEAVVMIRDVAAGELGEPELAAWIGANVEPVG